MVKTGTHGEGKCLSCFPSSSFPHEYNFSHPEKNINDLEYELVC